MQSSKNPILSEDNLTISVLMHLKGIETGGENAKR